MASETVDQRPRPSGQSAFAKPPDGMGLFSLRESEEQRLLRELSFDHDIRKTSSLVAVYNHERDKDKRTVMYNWLRLFGENPEDSLHGNAILDYAEIAKIVPRTTEDVELIKNLLDNIGTCIPSEEFAEKNVGKALYETLRHAPPIVLEDTNRLLSLTEKLLKSLSTRPILNRSSFKDCKWTFLSLRFILGYLDTVSHPQLSQVKKEEFRQILTQKHRDLRSSFKYFPVYFHFKMIQDSIDRLTVTKDSSFLGQALRFVTLETCGMRHQMTQILRPSTSPLDPSGLTPKNAAVKMRVRSSAGIREEHWITLIQRLAQAGMKMVQAAGEMENFADWCNTVMDIQQNLKEGEEQKALRYGAIHELWQLSIWAYSHDNQKRATKMLLDLWSTHGVNEAWAEDPDLFKAFLKGVYQIHVLGILREDTEAALRQLNDKRTPAADRIMEPWLRWTKFEEKLCVRHRRRVRSYWSKELSIVIGEKIGYLPVDDVYRSMKDVVKAYNQYDFTKAPSLVNNGDRKHVKEMEFCIVAYDKPEEDELRELSLRAGSGCDPVNAQFTWEKKTGERINPEDLFRPRSGGSTSRCSEIRKVLIYGNPGSGKTCLSRMIAHKWTQGDFMREFKVMYLLPVRKLCSVNEGGRGPLTLEQAIADICHSECRDTIQRSLYIQIRDNLSSQRTLLVLDGIDKADKLAKRIIANAKERQCKILLFSCSYDLCGELVFADRVGECQGLDDKQVKNLAESELSPNAFNEFMKYFKSNAELWKLMHIPVMAYILCLFWADNEETLVQEIRRKSVFSLYTKIVNMLWSRFSRRPRMDRVLREDVLRRIDVIAFRSIQENQKLIDRSILEEQASNGIVMGMLRDSGYLFFDMENDKCHFPNSTFQEYFAGRYIARRLRKGNSREQHESADFLTKRKYENESKMVIALTAQALADWRGTVVVREVFSSIDRSPVEILGVQHFFLKLQILDEWAAGLVDSLVDNDWIGGTACQVMNALVRVLNQLEPCTRLWNLIMDKLDQYRDLLSVFSAVLDTLTETRRAEELIGTHMFEDVVKLAKNAPRHLKVLVGTAREKLADQSPRVRKQGLDMIQDLLAHVPKLFGDLFLMLDRRYTDLDEDVRQKIILVIGNVAKKAPRLAIKLMAILKRGCVDANQGVRLTAMLSSEAFLSESPKIMNDLLPLLELGVSDSEEGVRMMAMLTIGRLLITSPSFLSDFVSLIERACGSPHEDVREKAMDVIGEMIEAKPDLSFSLMPMLERGTEDPSEDVRQTAMDAIDAARAAAVQPPGCSSSIFDDVGSNIHRGANRIEEEIGRWDSIAEPSSSYSFVGETKGDGDVQAKTDENDTIGDTFRDLISKVITEKNAESTRHLLELLFEYPVTIEETIQSDQVHIILHAKTSKSLGEYKRDDVHLLVSTVERYFEDEYPGILEVIRAA